MLWKLTVALLMRTYNIGFYREIKKKKKKKSGYHPYLESEIFSMVILSLPLIQEGQLSVSGERMCTIMVNSWRTKPAQ